MQNEEALRQWNRAAAGWARWEPVHNASLAAATDLMLDRAGVTVGSRVIDLACGAGDQTIAAARRAGPTGGVLATDISPAMLDFVAAQARAADLTTVATHACPAEQLPRDRCPFDAAICRLGLMLLPDPAAAVAAVRAALRPGGRLGALVFGPPEANPLYARAIAILRRHAGKPAPAAGPGLFALADTARLAALFETAGFTEVTVTTVDSTLSPPSAEAAARMIQEAAAGVHPIIADQPQSVRDAAWSEVHAAMKQFESSQGFAAPARYHVAAGRA